MSTDHEGLEFRQLLSDTQKQLIHAAQIINNAETALVEGAKPEQLLWCATTAGLLIGLRQQIKNVRELIFDHPVMRVDPQTLSTEGTEDAQYRQS